MRIGNDLSFPKFKFHDSILNNSLISLNLSKNSIEENFENIFKPKKKIPKLLKSIKTTRIFGLNRIDTNNKTDSIHSNIELKKPIKIQNDLKILDNKKNKFLNQMPAFLNHLKHQYKNENYLFKKPRKPLISHLNEFEIKPVEIKKNKKTTDEKKIKTLNVYEKRRKGLRHKYLIDSASRMIPNYEKLIKVVTNMVTNINKLMKNVSNTIRFEKYFKTIIISKPNLIKLFFQDEKKLNGHFNIFFLVEQCITRESNEKANNLGEQIDSEILSDFIWLNDKLEEISLQKELEELHQTEKDFFKEYHSLIYLTKKNPNEENFDDLNFERMPNCSLSEKIDEFELQYGECNHINKRERLLSKRLEEMLRNMKDGLKKPNFFPYIK